MSALLYLVFSILLDVSIAEVCHSPECVQSSEYILSKMDLTADPCQDFYQYTCGNWVNAIDIPEGEGFYNTQGDLSARNLAKLKNILKEGDTFLNGTHSSTLEKVSNFYKLCMNQRESKGVDEVVQFILDMFSWNVTSSHGVTWSEASWDFQTALTVNQAYGFSAFFEIDFSLRRNSFQFKPKHSGYSPRSGTRKRFLDFGAKVGELLGGDRVSVINEMTKIYDLQIQLSNLSGVSYNTTEMNISSFQKILGCKINVTNLLKERFGKSSFSEFKVVVDNPDYFEGLYSLISNTPKSTLANYIVWDALVEHIEYFPQQFLQAYNTIYLQEYQKENLKNKSREDQCLGFLQDNRLLFVALSAMFIEKSSFINKGKDKINTIVKEVQSAFERELMILPWLDDNTRQWAVKKASDIEDNIGYVDWVRDAKKVDKFYGDLDISPGKFLQSSLKIKRSLERQMFSLSYTEWNVRELSMVSLFPNAFYSEASNQFSITAGLLQKPAFTTEFPMSFNFGSIGSVTGHEITHGFDNEGMFTDVNDTWSMSWKNQTSFEFFNAQRNCLLEQYSNYTIGNATFASRRYRRQIISDNGGIQAAWNGFKNWQKSQDCRTPEELPGLPFSQDQMFFVGFGQLYCEYMSPEYIKWTTRRGQFRRLAGVFRSTGVVSNSDDFAEAFHCPRNSPMNPEAKCRIW
ncbi:endothelin-converting enzyme homolog isoform X2 [Ostrea edulis]|uniref:endothelin-converting enzyme homolog isoform X2 n=1 Tax=Ostrea edulis TaxID=37623 RepID=UPI0024AFB795|nr:endothelin-converting enzyme homolog isoform X2 [Ostrea edulis]